MGGPRLARSEPGSHHPPGMAWGGRGVVAPRLYRNGSPKRPSQRLRASGGSTRLGPAQRSALGREQGGGKGS